MESTPITMQRLVTMTLDQARDLPVADISALNDELAQMKAAVKFADYTMQCLLSDKFSGRAAALRSEAGKDTGTVRITGLDFVVVADLPKKVEWDQEILAESVANLAACGEDITEYVETEYHISETKFTSWPVSLQNIFINARTVGTGKPTFKIEKAKHA